MSSSIQAITQSILNPIRKSGRDQLSPYNLSNSMLDQYFEIAQGIFNVIQNSVNDLEPELLRQLKIDLWTAFAGYYHEIMTAKGERSEITAQVAKMMVSTAARVDLESQDGFAVYQLTHKETYEKIINILKDLRQTFNPLVGVRAVPSYPSSDIMGAIRQLPEYFISQAAGSKLTKAKERQLAFASAVASFLAPEVEKRAKSLDHPMDTVQLAMLLKQHTLAHPGETGSIAPSASFSFANSGFAVLPAFTSENEDRAKAIIVSETGGLIEGTILRSSNGWHEANVGTDDTNCDKLSFPTCLEVIGSMILAWSKQEMTADHITIPLSCFPVFPSLYDIFSRSYTDETARSFDFGFFEQMKVLAKTSFLAPKTPYSMYERMLTDKVAEDAVQVSTKARKQLIDNMYGDVGVAIKRHIKKFGTVQNQFVATDGGYSGRFPSDFVNNKTPSTVVEFDRPIWMHAEVPISTPILPTEVILVKPSRSPLSPFTMSVKGSDIVNAVQGLYKWDGLYENRIELRLGLKHVETSLMESRTEYGSWGVTSDVGPTNTFLKPKLVDDGSMGGAIYNYADYNAPRSLSLGDLARRFNVPAPMGDFLLWREFPSQAETVSVGFDAVPTRREVSVTQTVDSSFAVGRYTGIFVPDYENRRVEAIVDLTSRLYRCHFFERIPTLVPEVKYTRNFEDLPYHKRVEKFDDQYSKFSVTPDVFRLISHRMAQSYINQSAAIDPAVMEQAVTGEIYIAKVVERDIELQAQKTVRIITDNLSLKGNAITAFVAFVSGQLSIEQQVMLLKGETNVFFQRVLDATFEPIKGADTLFTLVYLQKLLASVAAYESAIAATRVLPSNSTGV